MMTLGEIDRALVRYVGELAELEAALGDPDLDDRALFESRRDEVADKLTKLRGEERNYLARYPDILRKTAANSRGVGSSRSSAVTRSTGNGHQAPPEGPATYAEARRQIEHAMLAMLDERDTPLSRSLNVMLRDMHSRLREAENRGKTMKTTAPSEMVWSVAGRAMAAEAKSRASDAKRLALRKSHPAATGPTAAHLTTLEQASAVSAQDAVLEQCRPSRLAISQHPAFARRF